MFEAYVVTFFLLSCTLAKPIYMVAKALASIIQPTEY